MGERDDTLSHGPASTRARTEQLDEGDAVFVAMETREAPSHIAGLTVVDPAGCDGFDFERFFARLEERLDRVPRFRRVLREVPFGLDRAYWAEAPEFDARRHVHRVAVPAPGDRRTLSALLGKLHATPLDRARPLWECWYIEGLEHGRVGVLMKVHHCLMDGQSGMGWAEILMDLSPEPAEEGAPATAEKASPVRPPALWEMGRRALVHGIERPRRMWVHSTRAARDGLLQWLGADSEGSRMPRAPFNHRLSADRAFAFASVPLAPLRDLKKHFDVKLNDVLLALAAGSLRRALRARRELPEASLVGVVPVSLREVGDQSFGNQLTNMSVRLGTDDPDPVQRLRGIAEESRRAKERLSQGHFEVVSALGEALVPGAAQLVMRLAHVASDRIPLPGNLVISNVRGLPIPTYLAGARVLELYPMSMLQAANGLNITAVSHDDQVDFGFLADPHLVPDPWVYADGIEIALQELVSSVGPSRPRAGHGRLDAPSPAESADASEQLDLSTIMAGLRGRTFVDGRLVGREETTPADLRGGAALRAGPAAGKGR